MPACAFTSKFARKRFRSSKSTPLAFFFGISLFASCFAVVPAFAVDAPPPAAGPEAAPGSGRTQVPEEDDFKSTPYTSFGEFSDEDETEDTRFFQYGRFFGVSLGVGYEGTGGNRGALFTGGFPAVEVRVHYWFDFNLALTLGIYTAKHQFVGAKFDNDAADTTHDFSLFRLGAELRYYFDTRDATAPVTFAGPFVLAGFGSYQKTESDITATESGQKDESFGFSIGGGLEFPLKPRKCYLDLEMKLHSVSFNDTGLPVTTPGGKTIPNTSGPFFTAMASVLFTY